MKSLSLENKCLPYYLEKPSVSYTDVLTIEYIYFISCVLKMQIEKNILK